MFQECLIVLRSIVLHSLGIKQSSDSSQHTVVQNLSSQIGTYPNQVSPQTQAAPSSVASESSPNKSHRVINVSPRNKMGHVFMTPSPNSRISSGFGSLHSCHTAHRDELSHIGEQLAAHHAQYTQLQRSGANHEHVCAEKIAEQQLRLKQV